MIAKIYSPNDNMTETINYNFKKIDDKKGYIIESNVDEIFHYPKDFKDLLLDVISQNKDVRIKDNNIRHMSLSLKKNEHLSDDKFSELSERYLRELGYENSPMVCIRHTDTDKEHVHILVSQVDFDGKRISDSNERYRSQEISRKLEIEFELSQVEYMASNNFKALEHFHKYSLSKLVLKLDKEKLEDFKLKYKILFDNKVKTLTNEEIKNLLKEEYSNFQVDIENAFPFGVEKLKKEKLIDQLDVLRNASISGEDFINKVSEQKDLYVRPVFQNGQKVFVYGIKEDIYLTQGQYPNRFNYNSLSTYKGKQQGEFNFKDQRSFIKSTLKRTIPKCNSIELLEKELYKKGVKMELVVAQTGTVRGVKFSSLNIDNAKSFNGSEIGKEFSYQNILSALPVNQESLPSYGQPFDKEDYFERDNHHANQHNIESDINMFFGGAFFGPENNDELEKENRKKRKKKKKKGRGM